MKSLNHRILAFVSHGYFSSSRSETLCFATAGQNWRVTECPRRLHRWQIQSLKEFLLVFCIHRTEGFLDKIVEKPHRRYTYQPSRNRCILL